MAGPSAPRDAQQVLERRIKADIRKFDIPALVDLLAKLGYGPEELEYRSQRTDVHQGHLVHAIEFLPPPRKRAIITVNVGLLSVQSRLPSFLLQTLAGMDHDRLERYLGYFDHLLLRARFAGLHPERDEALLAGWSDTVLHRLHLLRPTSPSTLHWLFAAVYPEVEVSVRREVRRQQVPSTGIRLGATALGDSAATGGFAYVPTGGLEVTLSCDEPFSGTGTSWSVEAPRRLDARIFPVLAATPMLLTVILLLRDHDSYARIEKDSYLGYDPLVFGPGDDQRIVLFTGDTARHGTVISPGQEDDFGKTA